MPEFDASIDIGPYNLPAHYDPAVAVEAVRHAVEALPGAGWISVEHQGLAPPNAPWLAVYPRGQCAIPDTEQWRQLAGRVETVIRGALELAARGAP